MIASFNPFRPDVSKWKHFPVGEYGIFQIAGRKGLSYSRIYYRAKYFLLCFPKRKIYRCAGTLVLFYYLELRKTNFTANFTLFTFIRKRVVKMNNAFL